MKRRLGFALAAGVVLPLVLAAVAAAEGAPSIASAPVISYGQQAFGNTANGSHFSRSLTSPYLQGWNSFWSLPVVAGDQITVDWEAPPRSGTHLQLYAPGTSDFTVGHARPLAEDFEGEQGRNELRYTAATSGAIPLDVRTQAPNGSTYAFTAYVRHALTLSTPRMDALPHAKTVKIGVHSPEGGTISDPSLIVKLEARAGGAWQTVGRAKVINSVAKVQERLPRSLWHGNVSLRATASGSSYVTTRTSVRHVLVP